MTKVQLSDVPSLEGIIDVLNKNPLCAKAFNDLAQGEKEMALEAFSKAQEQDPRNGLISCMIGGTLLGMERYKEAELSLFKAERIVPEDPYPNIVLSVLYNKLKMNPETPEDSQDWVHACLAKEKAYKAGDVALYEEMSNLVNHLNPKFPSNPVPISTPDDGAA